MPVANGNSSGKSEWQDSSRVNQIVVGRVSYTWGRAGPRSVVVGQSQLESSPSLTWMYSEHMMMAIETHVFHLVPALSHEPQLD
jgi:hypothetical protein